jgi:hypothetical protein
MEMEKAASTIPSIPTREKVFELWFLTGKRFWYQTAFCAWTFAQHSQANISLNLIDDGTLQEAHIEQLRRIFHQVSVVKGSDVQQKNEQLLPFAKYPILRQRWLDYINIRKLTDIHLGSSGKKLVLDSDMLFFKRPDMLLQWLEAKTPSLLHMVDCVESYGYSRVLMEQLAGGALPQKLNVGICGLKSEWLDWDEIEFWCRTLLEKEGTNYYLEQALVAMLSVRHSRTEVSAADYITFPTREQVSKRVGVLQHYVADSKLDYFQGAWRFAASNSLPADKQ